VLRSLFEGSAVGIMTTIKADDACKKITMLSVHQVHWFLWWCKERPCWVNEYLRFWLCIQYGVWLQPRKQDEAGNIRCLVILIGVIVITRKHESVFIITLQTWRCYSNFEKKRRSIAKTTHLNSKSL
jgi:hypothetical protein